MTQQEKEDYFVHKIHSLRDENDYIKTNEIIALIKEHEAAVRKDQIEKDAKIAEEYPKRDPAEDGNAYWAAEEISKVIRSQLNVEVVSKSEFKRVKAMGGKPVMKEDL